MDEATLGDVMMDDASPSWARRIAREAIVARSESDPVDYVNACEVLAGAFQTEVDRIEDAIRAGLFTLEVRS